MIVDGMFILSLACLCLDLGIAGLMCSMNGALGEEGGRESEEGMEANVEIVASSSCATKNRNTKSPHPPARSRKRAASPCA